MPGHVNLSTQRVWGGIRGIKQKCNIGSGEKPREFLDNLFPPLGTRSNPPWSNQAASLFLSTSQLYFIVFLGNSKAFGILNSIFF